MTKLFALLSILAISSTSFSGTEKMRIGEDYTNLIVSQTFNKAFGISDGVSVKRTFIGDGRDGGTCTVEVEQQILSENAGPVLNMYSVIVQEGNKSAIINLHGGLKLGSKKDREVSREILEKYDKVGSKVRMQFAKTDCMGSFIFQSCDDGVDKIELTLDPSGRIESVKAVNTIGGLKGLWTTERAVCESLH